MRPQRAPDTKAEHFSSSIRAHLGSQAIDPVPASGSVAAEARLQMYMVFPSRVSHLRGRNEPKIVAIPPSFDLPPPVASATGAMGDCAVPNALALPVQASSDLARELWEMRDRTQG